MTACGQRDGRWPSGRHRAIIQVPKSDHLFVHFSTVSPPLRLLCSVLIVGAAVTWLVDKMIDVIIDSCFQYLQDRIGLQASVEELDRLRGYRDKIQDVVSASNQAQISDCNEALDEWMQRLRDAIHDANDLLKEFQHLELKEQLARPSMEKGETKKQSFVPHFLSELSLKICKVGDGVLKNDPNLKRLAEVVQNLNQVSAEGSHVGWMSLYLCK